MINFSPNMEGWPVDDYKNIVMYIYTVNRRNGICNNERVEWSIRVEARGRSRWGVSKRATP